MDTFWKIFTAILVTMGLGAATALGCVILPFLTLKFIAFVRRIVER